MINKSLLLVVFLIQFMTVEAQDRLSFLALGDSYTIGESVSENERWPVLLSNALNERGFNIASPKIIATTGWRTDELKTAIEKADLDKSYDLVSLLIGVNNQYQGKSPESYKPEFEELLNVAIKYAGGDKSRVFVVSIPDYGFTPFGEKKKDEISTALDRYNAINKAITEQAGVTYINITDISRSGDPSLVAKDNLHPSGKQYALWVERMLENIQFFEKLK